MRTEKTASIPPTALFEGMSPEERAEALKCLDATSRRFEKGAFLLLEGEAAERFGLVLSGRVAVIKEDAWGNRTILTKLDPGELFGEAFHCAGEVRATVSVQADEPCEILFMAFPSASDGRCAASQKLNENMLRVLARKNVLLIQRIDVLSRRGLRDKLAAYLSDLAKRSGARSFDVPCNRQEMADTLCSDRSALSRELCRMRDEGLLRFEKKRFTLLE